ncbi:MAG: FAD-binding protein [Coriobacteriales bacterium]|nr:FAD-binding protein [Coriobacteriales bacterium]
MSELSSRGFLKGTALAVAGAASVGLMACASKEQGTADGAKEAAISWDEEYDVVVVGSGLAGASAAVSVAVEGNGETCLLLEKSPYALGGGNSPYSGGQVLYTDKENYEGCLQYLKDLRGPFDTTSDDVLEAYATYLQDNFNFLKSLGAKEEDYTFEDPGKLEGQSCWPEYPEFESAWHIGHVIFTGEEIKTVSMFMLSVIEQHTDVITHKTEAPATSLIQDQESKAILGVVYLEGGSEVKVKANKAVIMCCGGFESNQTMRQDYLSLVHAHPLAGVYNTGDGFPMCQKVGASMWHMNSMAGGWTNAVTVDGVQHAGYGVLAKEKGIVVGISGRRYFMDVDYGVKLDWETTKAGGATNETEVGCKHGHSNYGGEWPHAHQPEKSWFLFDNANKIAALSGLSGSMLTENPEEDGWGFQADTISELARKINVPEKELETTINSWNRDCAAGLDTAFYRPAHWMTSIVEPPFYAICQEPILLNTDGGPKRNAKGQVLDLDDTPIPNLYSSGEFGSIWCNMYQGGGNLGECVAFSRICVNNALGLS